MTTDEKAEFLLELDNRLLLGGLMVSQWSAFLVQEADIAFLADANLATIALCQSAMESHLRYEYRDCMEREPNGFFDLIQMSPLDDDLRDELHAVRKIRNRWMHVSDPWDDEDLIADPARHAKELESVALKAVELLRRVLYLEQWT